MQTAFSFDKDTLTKIGKGFLIGLGGAFLTYATEFVASVDFGGWTPLVVMFAAGLINAGREYVKGSEIEE
jgi:hypothetical protein